MNSNPKWGNKFECFSCECKFYDLNKPKAICPKCGADQADKRLEEVPVEEVVEEEVVKVKEVASELLGEVGEVVASTNDDLPEMEEELGYDETDEEE